MNPRIGECRTHAHLDPSVRVEQRSSGAGEGETGGSEWGVGGCRARGDLSGRPERSLRPTRSSWLRVHRQRGWNAWNRSDAVRFLGTGPPAVGVALAEEARKRGAEVTSPGANLGCPPIPGVEVVESSHRSGRCSVRSPVSTPPSCLMAAAFADYRRPTSRQKTPEDTRCRSGSSRHRRAPDAGPSSHERQS